MFELLSYYISMPWVYWTLMVLYGVTVAGIIAVVVSENRNPLKSLAWVTVLLLLPVMGVVFYIFFGRSIKNKRMISRRNSRRLKRKFPQQNAKHEMLSHESAQHIQLTRALGGSTLYTTDSVEIFTNGSDKFEALITDLMNAKKYINLQYYIFEDDNIGRRIRDILVERARAGVIVRVIYDHVGSFKVPNKFFKSMREAGIMCYPFFKVTFPAVGTRINWRNHRKLCIIDGKIGYIGGMNIADRYIDGGKKFGCWRDTHVRITGPAVSGLQFSFAVDWNFMGLPLIEEEVPSAPHPNEGMQAAVQVLTSGPMSQWTNIAFIFFKAIATAKKRIYLQTPYFLPTESLLKALQAAALAKIDVRVMIPRRSDSKLLRNASFSYIAECLQAGIKFYLFDPGMLHAKTMVIDDELTTIGSTNFDFRSFEHNFEGNLFIYSTEVNRKMTEIFLADQQHCTRITASMWRKRPLSQKWTESIVRLLSPIL